MEFYNIKVKDMYGRTVTMQEYKGKVLLIVNTATGCGFTPQYEGLENLYKKYKREGFEILDFPCNQFGGQAPGTAEEINNFCTMKYGVSFRQFEKIDVNGENESPLFTFLKSKKSSILGPKIKWNFTKFLINRNGEVVARYSPMDTPERIDKDIMRLCSQK
ncbi:MAG TPA: glutathione peroxidase [Petrotogaceae bacterium]|nr:glutathione peroxidase [Petrotogaceae bacterium]